MTKTVLCTQRLILRPLVAEDAEAIAPLIGDYEVSKWLAVVPHPYAIDDALWFINSEGNRAGQTWAITRDEQVMGVISATKELGYWLGRPFWRNGYMSEAAQAVVSAVFSDGKTRSISSGYFVGNTGSCAILTSLGFRKSQLEQVHARAQGRVVSSQRMKLIRSDWQALHG